MAEFEYPTVGGSRRPRCGWNLVHCDWHHGHSSRFGALHEPCDKTMDSSLHHQPDWWDNRVPRLGRNESSSSVLPHCRTIRISGSAPRVVRSIYYRGPITRSVNAPTNQWETQNMLQVLMPDRQHMGPADGTWLCEIPASVAGGCSAQTPCDSSSRYTLRVQCPFGLSLRSTPLRGHGTDEHTCSLLA